MLSLSALPSPLLPLDRVETLGARRWVPLAAGAEPGFEDTGGEEDNDSIKDFFSTNKHTRGHKIIYILQR